LARRCPAWRWRELDSGFDAERGNLCRDTVAGQWRMQWPAAGRESEPSKRRKP
jgi:hypothetical protein